MDSETAGTTISAAQAFGQYLIPMLIGAGGMMMFALGFGQAIAALRMVAIAAAAVALLAASGGPVQAQTKRGYADFAAASSCTNADTGTCPTNQIITVAGARHAYCSSQRFEAFGESYGSVVGGGGYPGGSGTIGYQLFSCYYAGATEYKMGVDYTYTSSMPQGACVTGNKVRRYARHTTPANSSSMIVRQYTDTMHENQTWRVVKVNADGSNGVQCTNGVGEIRVSYLKNTTNPVPNACLFDDGSPQTIWADVYSNTKDGDLIVSDKDGSKCEWKVSQCDYKNGQTFTIVGKPGRVFGPFCLLTTTGVDRAKSESNGLSKKESLLTKEEIAQIVRDAWNEIPDLEMPVGTPDEVAGPLHSPAPATKVRPDNADVTPPEQIQAVTQHDPQGCNQFGYYHPGNRDSEGGCVGSYDRDQPKKPETPPPSKDEKKGWCWKPSPQTCTKEELSILDPQTGDPIPVPTFEQRYPNTPWIPPTGGNWCSTCGGGQGATTNTPTTNPDGGSKPPVAGDTDGDGKAEPSDGSDLYTRKTTGTIGEAWKAEVDALKAAGGLGAGLVAAFDLSGTVSTGDWCKSMTLPGAFMQATSVSLCIPAKYLDLLYTLNIMLASWAAVMLTISRGA